MAAAVGIDYLNLIKSQEELQQQNAAQQQNQVNQELVKQTGQLAGSPMMDPSKNPNAAEDFQALTGALQADSPDE